MSFEVDTISNNRIHNSLATWLHAGSASHKSIVSMIISLYSSRSLRRPQARGFNGARIRELLHADL